MAEQVKVTVSDELLVLLDEARGFESRASFCRRAVEAALDCTERSQPETAKSVRDAATVTTAAAPASPRPSELPAPNSFRCPIKGCTASFGSAAAKCPVHGRKVVPA